MRSWPPPSTTGLSPRVRGNLASTIEKMRVGRSIPACAGEPGSPFSRRPCSEVYPRVCGGTSPWQESRLAPPGLSPRVRGNHNGPAPRPSITGSIPACAGEPPLRPSLAPSATVYPRVCGGTSAGALYSSIVVGLSPRVRGNPRARHSGRNRRGSIPACAGEPPCADAKLPPSAVYPRVCGGTTGHVAGYGAAIGLSPRVRGNLALMPRPPASPGSIPACAGEPVLHQLPLCPLPVYPRVCGGTPPPPKY